MCGGLFVNDIGNLHRRLSAKEFANIFNRSTSIKGNRLRRDIKPQIGLRAGIAVNLQRRRRGWGIKPTRCNCLQSFAILKIN